MSGRTVGVFDRVAMVIAVASLLIMLYMGLVTPSGFQDYWVAFALWSMGLFGSIGLKFVQIQKNLTLGVFLQIFMGAGLIFVAFFGMNLVYSASQPGDLFVFGKALSFAFGVAEELFFGLFILGLLINWFRLPPIVAVVVSSVAHAAFHIPNWGFDLRLIALFTGCFIGARLIYIYGFRYAGVLLAAHGAWNYVVTPAQVVKALMGMSI